MELGDLKIIGNKCYVLIKIQKGNTKICLTWQEIVKNFLENNFSIHDVEYYKHSFPEYDNIQEIVEIYTITDTYTLDKNGTLRSFF